MKTEAETNPKPPLVVLTGFLGAGKTTTLNRVLGRQLRLRVGVIINELGRIDIDTRLIKSRAGDVMELAGGCVCHEVRVQSELWAAIDGGEPALAPGGRAAGDDRHRRAVVDPFGAGGSRRRGAGGRGRRGVRDRRRGGRGAARASRGGARAGRGGGPDPADEAGSRRAPTRSWRCTGSSRRRNPAAERASFPAGDEGTAALVPWLLDVRGAPRVARAGRHAHAHGQLTVVTFTDPEPLLARAAARGDRGARRRRWCARRDSCTSRATARRGFLERAGVRSGLAPGEPWADATPGTELVLIGDALDGDAIRRQLWACRARRVIASDQ